MFIYVSITKNMYGYNLPFHTVHTDQGRVQNHAPLAPWPLQANRF